VAKKRFRILDMEHESFWDEKKKLPRFLYPHEHSLDPCASCRGLCCSSTIHLTTVEALRLRVALSMPLELFVVLEPATGGRGAKQTVPIPLDDGPVRLALKQRPGSDECVLLHRVEHRALCSAYGLRPGACRVFPYTAQLGDRVVSAGAPVPCPTRWLWNDTVAQRVRADVEGWLKDIAFERTLVDAWIAAPVADRGFASYERFAIAAAAGHLGYDAARVLEPPRRRLGEPAG
jgi:Fe-S-cluster containining protein